MNRGAEELRKTVTAHGSKVRLAQQVGVKPYQLSHFLKGVRKPNYEQRAWFEDNLKIGWRLWDIDTVVAKIPKRAVAKARPIRRAGSVKMTTRGAA